MCAPLRRPLGTILPAGVLAISALLAGPAAATEFSVTPIRVELKPGVMSETIAITNHAPTRLRVSIKLMEWTQDASGQDIQKESSELIWFPRQMEVEPNGKRLVRVGAKAPAATVEKSYRLWVEEEPPGEATPGRAQVAFYFRFGVPVFVQPAGGRPEPEVPDPTLGAGKVSVVVRNKGNQHFRLNRVAVRNEAGQETEVGGWYSLPGTERTYTVDVPREACLQSKVLDVALEGEGFRIDRKLHVDPASCR